MRDIGKASRRPRRFARATEGGFPRLSGCVAHGCRCAASLRHALLAENLEKPSLWVITKDLWYRGAVHLLSQNLRVELQGSGVRVTEICPGRVETEFFEIAVGEEAAKAAYEGFEVLVPDDVAAAILYALDAP